MYIDQIKDIAEFMRTTDIRFHPGASFIPAPVRPIAGIAGIICWIYSQDEPFLSVPEAENLAISCLCNGNRIDTEILRNLFDYRLWSPEIKSRIENQGSQHTEAYIAAEMVDLFLQKYIEFGPEKMLALTLAGFRLDQAENYFKMKSVTETVQS